MGCNGPQQLELRNPPALHQSSNTTSNKLDPVSLIIPILPGYLSKCKGTCL